MLSIVNVGRKKEMLEKVRELATTLNDTSLSEVSVCHSIPSLAPMNVLCQMMNLPLRALINAPSRYPLAKLCSKVPLTPSK